MSAPKRVRIDDPGVSAPEVATSGATSHTHGNGNRRAYYAALGKMALQNMRSSLDWCVNALRLPVDRNRRDAERNPHEH